MLITLYQLTAYAEKIFALSRKNLIHTTLILILVFLIMPLKGETVSITPLTCSTIGKTEINESLNYTLSRSLITDRNEVSANKRQVSVTAYTSEVAQTDDTPFITASNTLVRDGIVAANFLPFGTRIKIEGFGNKVFIVEDRMHKRFSNYVDIWMNDKSEALKFGVQKLEITVLD